MLTSDKIRDIPKNKKNPCKLRFFIDKELKHNSYFFQAYFLIRRFVRLFYQKIFFLNKFGRIQKLNVILPK